MKTTRSNQISLKEFRLIFDTYYKPLCIFSNKYLNDIELSKDVVQEVFIKIWDKQVNNSNDAAMKSYLYTAVRNKSLDYLKSNAYKLKNSLSEAELKKMQSDSYYTREVLLEESSQQIQQAVNSLPFRCKEIIKLSLNGYKNEEISKELCISINTVKTQKRIAYGKLKVLLKGSILFIAHVFTEL